MSPEITDRIPGIVRKLSRRNSAKTIGAILVETGRLSALDAERIIHLQKEINLSFGAAGMELGLLSRADVDFALAQQYDYPYLIDAGELRVSNDLVAALLPFSAPVESLRALRSQLVLRWFNNRENSHALAVIGPQRGDGRSYLVANLAIVFSQLGQRTLLIDADMRNSRQHTLFVLANGNGLSSVLSGRRQLDSIQRIENFTNLSILTAGPRPPNPQELLGRDAFADLLDECEEEFDVVLIDTPAGNDYADAQTVCVLAGGAILAARRNHTSLSDANRMSSDLSRHGVQMLGVVLSEF
ncbi:MAG: chain length determinant protein tyrosine kinase EpsG [Rugosibacter sp.]